MGDDIKKCSRGELCIGIKGVKNELRENSNKWPIFEQSKNHFLLDCHLLLTKDVVYILEEPQESMMKLLI